MTAPSRWLAPEKHTNHSSTKRNSRFVSPVLRAALAASTPRGARRARLPMQLASLTTTTSQKRAQLLAAAAGASARLASSRVE